MARALKLPIIDLSDDDKISTANSVLQACTETRFFYVINHGVDKAMFEKLICESGNFFSLPLDEKREYCEKHDPLASETADSKESFSLPLEEKKKLDRKEHRGYIPFYKEKIDPSASDTVDSKESFYIGPFEDCLNQWPSKDSLPAWRDTMEAYYEQILLAGKKLLSLMALALDLEENFFTLKPPSPFLRLLHYPDELHNGEVFGVSPHTDYGMVTLLATDGGPGLQVCREKDCQPRIWEDVPHIDGASIVNIGDLLERWTNCRFRSTLHRVMPTSQERYSAAFFLDPNSDCVVECLESCCSESSPPKFPPIRSGDYLEQRLKATYT